ncbi:sugar phosphate isomerase/epimerase [Paenibacillus sp. J2TS4]|uniref:sugar phosphate isomerase/epimerase family protein n=1 Tax=Paenibacillus sp. J2TS4 TaxID=2807194 RepID=UPI001B227242|nr:sugar phosphate isomerase/epimerase family protein [Paenibacillus sp. J2TS4]GIP33517.1 hypothetical protein J2TS4_27270 [Paenibacillus sp. J2TS4]
MRQLEEWKVGTSYRDRNSAGLEQLKRTGLDCIELVLHGEDWHNHFEVLAKKYTDIVHEATRLDMQVWSVHLPFGDEWDVSCPDAALRKTIIENQYRMLQLADSWGVGIAVLHPSFEPIPAEDRHERLAICRESLHALANLANHLDIRVAVECLPRTCLGNSSDEILQLIEPTSELVVCCDVNHLLHESAEAFINKLGSRIGTVHMSDYDGIDERHWMPGQGIIEWNKVLKALAEQGYQGPFMFEVRDPQAEELISCWEGLKQQQMI